MKCGVVDIGSNTIQLSVYDWEEKTFRSLFQQWETVGLANYVEGGILSNSGIAAACRTLAHFCSLLHNLEIEDIHVFATASLRNISNSAQALAAIQERTGLAVVLLSGQEEAKLSFRGALLGGAPALGLLTDIGGGSSELVAYCNGTISSEASLPVGVVSLFTRFVDELLPSPAELESMRKHVASMLTEVVPARAKTLVAVGGTARAVVRLCNALCEADLENRTVSAHNVYSLYTMLAKGDKAALRLILRNAPDRVHTLLPGLVLLTAILDHCGAEQLILSTCGVREGYLAERVMRK